MAKPRNKRKRSVKKVYAPASAIPQELAGEISFRESALFRGYRPTPFNPDELVGQKGLKTYKKMMVDEQVKAAVLAKHYAVLASGYETIPPDSDDAEKREVNEEMTDFTKFNFEEMEGSFDSKLLEILSGTIFGFSVSEKVLHYIDYGRFKGKIGLKAIKTRQPFNIDFDVDEYGNLMNDGILQDQTFRMPKEKFVTYVHRKTFDNFYGEPDLRSAYRSFWLKDNILRFMAITLERYGEPTPIFKHAQRLSVLQKAELIDFISKKGAKSGIIIPADITLEFQQPDPRTGTVYVPAIDLCDTHIRIALLMPGLIGMSAEQAVGSLARSQTEFDAFLWVIEQLRKDIETIIDEEVIKQLIDLNYDVTDSKYPSFRFKKITEEIKQGLFKMWSDAVNGNALTKTREDENKARGLIDFPPLPDDVPVKGELQAPGTTLPDGRIVGADGKPVDTAESLAMRQPKLIPFTHEDGHKDYWFRALTKYERRVDFKAIQGVFDEDALTVDSQIRAELRKTRDSLLKKIETADNAAQITSEFIAGLKLDTNQEVGRILGDYLLDVWRSGRDLAFKELPGAIKAKVEPVRQFEKIAAYQTGLEPVDALNYFRTRALILAGIIDDELLKQAKFELLEHIKGGRPLIETIGNLRSVFEPWVGDPTKIGPSGQIGIGFPPGTMAPENILMAFRLENVVRTESTTAMAQGRVAIGDAAGDYVIGYQLSAILDSRTCFSEFTYINTPLGKRRIDSIVPNAIIMSGSGKPKRVKACWRYAAASWRKLVFEDGRSVTCTPTHAFWTKIENRFGWIEAHELKNGDIIGTDGDSFTWIERNAMPSVWPTLPPLQQCPPQVLLSSMLSQMATGEIKENKAVSELRCPSQEEVWNKEKILQQGMLGDTQGCVDNAKLPTVFQHFPENEERFAASREGWEVLQSEVLSPAQGESNSEDLPHVQNSFSSANIKCFSLHGLFKKMLPDMEARRASACHKKLEMPNLPQAAVGNSETEQSGVYAVLLGGLQDARHETVYTRADGGQYIKPNANRVSEAKVAGAIRDGLLSATVQDHAGDRRDILAPQAQEIRCGERPASAITWNIASADIFCGQLQAVSRPTAIHADHNVEPRAAGTLRLVSNELIDDLAWAYDLEIEDDHSYIAEGLIVHNTEICKAADGLLFRKEDPNSIKLLPALHYQCRTVPIFATTDELPIEWSSQAKIDAVLRLIPAGFK